MALSAVTLCIINHNGAEHLRKAFHAVQAQPWVFSEVLLVDNASSDDSLEVARAMCPEARVIQLPRNLGPGAARNAGFTAAAHDLILFQDNDIRLDIDTAEQLVSHLQTWPDALAVAPRVLYANAPATVQFDSADCHFLGLMATRNADVPLGGLDSNPCETSSLVSACFLINRQCWHGAAPFDDSLGFNLEDHDFGVRARLAGYSLWVQPGACVQHGSGTPGISYRPGQRPSDKRMYYLTVNRWIVITKCYAMRTLVILSPALLAFEVMQLVWLTAQGHFRAWRQAVSSLVRRRRQLRTDRQAIQRARCVPDNAVLRDAPLPMTVYVRDTAPGRYLVPLADRLLRSYWRLVRRWV